MAIISKVLGFFFATEGRTKTTQVSGDLGAGYTAQAPLAQPAGVASAPRPGDLQVCAEVEGQGQLATVGFIDPDAPQDLAAGETIVYSRDGNGALVSAAKFRTSGEVTMANGNGGLTLHADGRVTINGVTFDPSGNVSGANKVEARNVEAAQDVKAGVISLLRHTHISASPGNPTSPPQP